MTTAHRIAVTFTLSFIIIVIAFVLSIVTPALDAQAMTRGDNNVNMPGLTEDRYTGESKNIVTLITDVIIPAMLPPTSGQCGEDSGIEC